MSYLKYDKWRNGSLNANGTSTICDRLARIEEMKLFLEKFCLSEVKVIESVFDNYLILDKALYLER